MTEEIKKEEKENPGEPEEKETADQADARETPAGSPGSEAGKAEETRSEGSEPAGDADADQENGKEPDGGRDRGKEPRKVRKLESKIAELEKKLAASEAAAAEKDGKYLLLYAEYDNFRRRSQKEKEGIWTDAYSDAVQKLLPVLDNLYRAVDSGCTDPATVTEGLKLTLKSYEDALKQMGVEEIPALGETFNPELHSAVMHIDDDSFGEGEIVEVFGKGYQRGGRVIRHSIVKVAN